MKSFFASILGLFLLLGCLVSCEHKAPTVQSVTFDTLTVDTICPLFHSYDKPACHLSIKMAKPEAQTPAEIMLAIESFISTLPKDGSFEEEANGSIESMVNAYVKVYIMQYLNEGHDAIGQHEGETEEMEAATAWMNYEEIVEGRILYNDNGFVSYQVVADNFTGGAHGNRTIDNGVFNLNTLSQISLTDLIAEKSLNDLNTLVRNQLMVQYECNTLDELAEKGLFTAPNEIEVTDNFYINDEGITWTYDPYEIAPYSVGVVQISLTWDDVMPYLAPEFPVQSIVQQ